jgi:hypothetical protein
MKDWQLAEFCLNTYVPPCQIMVGADLACNIIDTADGIVVAFRGTVDAEGWARDFDAVPKYNHLVGWCHEGFLNGATALMQRINLPNVPDPLIFTGHSLGAALAAIVFCLRRASHERADQLVTFGSPRPGYAALGGFASGLPVREYLRGNDPVPSLPYNWTAFPYVHIREPMIGIGHADLSNAWNCHSIRGYLADLKAGDK